MGRMKLRNESSADRRQLRMDIGRKYWDILVQVVAKKNEEDPMGRFNASGIARALLERSITEFAKSVGITEKGK